MHFFYQLHVALVAGAVAAMASSSAKLLAPGAQIRSPPVATHTPAHYFPFRSIDNNAMNNKESTTLNNNTIDEKLYGPAQQVLMGCPEMFKDPLIPCSLCGGESKRSPGRCNDPNASGWTCQCTNVGPNGLTTSLVTTTAKGQTATGTFELDNMTEYKSLRQSITINTTTSISTSATTTGDTGLETVAVVVFAGGVAWFLADASGGAAAIAALEAPADAPNHEDDKKCPDPKEQCKDCGGGEEQMCTTGTNVGCACEADNCPSDGSEEQPVCTDDSCEGKDGKCTTGENNDCNCKKPPCPDIKKYTFWCSMCGGKGSDGKCKGDPEDDNNWQDCDCSDDPDWSLNPTPQRVRPDAKKHRQALANTPDIEYPPDPLPDAKCDQTKSSQVPYNVFSPGVYSNFCNDVDQDKSKALTETLDSSSKVIQGASKEKRDVSKRTPPPNPGTYKDYNFTLSWSGGDKSCPYNCSDVFYKIAQGPCGRTAGEQNIMASSASLDTGCGIYSYNITTPAPPSSPSPSPSVNCHSGSTPGGYVQFSRDAASDMVNEICTELVDSKVVLSQSGSSLPPASMNDIFQKSGNNVAANGATLVINPHWALGGCADQNNPQDVDFGSMPINDCAGYFMTAIDGCPEFDNPSGTQFWKWGGTNQAACAFWSVQAG